MKKVINVDDLVVTIKYRKNMKNIYLKVEKNADVVVSAPPRTPNYLIKKLITCLDHICHIVKTCWSASQEFRCLQSTFSKNRSGISGMTDRHYLVLSSEDHVMLSHDGTAADCRNTNLLRVSLLMTGAAV